MKITNDLIIDLEEQSKIKLSEPRRGEMISEIEDFLGQVDSMKALDTENTEPLYHLFPISNVFREDAVTNVNRREELLANAPEQKDGHFKVPKTLE